MITLRILYVYIANIANVAIFAAKITARKYRPVNSVLSLITVQSCPVYTRWQTLLHNSVTWIYKVNMFLLLL